MYTIVITFSCTKKRTQKPPTYTHASDHCHTSSNFFSIKHEKKRCPSDHIHHLTVKRCQVIMFEDMWVSNQIQNWSETLIWCSIVVIICRTCLLSDVTSALVWCIIVISLFCVCTMFYACMSERSRVLWQPSLLLTVAYYSYASLIIYSNRFLAEW